MPYALRSLRPFAALLAASMTATALGQINVPSNGSSGAFEPTGANYEVDLSLARTGRWDDANVGPNGVYDPEKWAVVFHYTSVNIPSGTTVRFKNHPSNPPVVWLVQGSVNISGTVNLDGQDSGGGTGVRIPGPGGFRGGVRSDGQVANSGGFGPGGGGSDARRSGSFGTVGNQGSTTYSFQRVIPLIGGSGGSGNTQNGGAGGGAILIVAGDEIIVSGGLYANGGTAGFFIAEDQSGGGSGGAIRLIANRVSGTGRLEAACRSRGYGGLGRISVERNLGSFTGVVDPADYYDLVGIGTEPIVWPEHWEQQVGTPVPEVRVIAVDSQVVPTDPKSLLTQTEADVTIEGTTVVTVRIQSWNVPTDGSWGVQLRVVPRNGADRRLSAVWNETEQLWIVRDVQLAPGAFAMQARAFKR